MKHLFITGIATLVCSVCINARTIQPVIFDDPDFDIHSAELTAEQRSFFDQYVQAMQRMEAGEDAEKLFILERALTKQQVDPLLKDINFNQETPYNNLCPKVNSNRRSLTGCVATSMAMVMRYYKFPEVGSGSFTYTGGTGGAQTYVLDDHPFEWENILPTYDGVSYTPEQANAVATLMLACGASLTMNYSADGSGANLEKVDGLLRNNFHYDQSVAYISTANSSDPDYDIEIWGEDAVRPNLDAGWPLIFAGFPATGRAGHCFVVDGYREESGVYYYHVNWGWGGVGNCWCLLTRLQDPDGNNYSGHNLSMVYNIHPTNWQDVDELYQDKAQSVTKTITDGLFVITRNGKNYTALGQMIR